MVFLVLLEQRNIFKAVYHHGIYQRQILRRVYQGKADLALKIFAKGDYLDSFTTSFCH